ncbi:FAD dependent oxidoreductase [Brevibacterium sanguinis]|uniref:FAD dependent oxidoreductase n=2 Tax=Brevibacterium TaxID=1696 RepID=A0A366IGI4_9MICO|nr:MULTISPECIES: FAD-dependent oxidoreductase [Brevibacterium]RBP62226.1 FAD dependent oxidoreductase [Brevibacterium sanguinis]RBP70642.1 FAD dependent oxidoreductase [Brevibacterium celere]
MSIARVAVVGAGLVGLAVAREISERLPDAQVTVFDKEDGVAAHQSGHTSGIVDAGLEEEPNSLSAALTRRGVERLVPYISERGIPYRECGQLVVAQDTDDADRLEEMLARAEANGVPGVRLLDRTRMREIEPHCRGVLALYSPHTAVIDFPALAEALASDVRAVGGEIRLGTEITGIDVMADEVRLRARLVQPASDAGPETDDRPTGSGRGRGADGASETDGSRGGHEPGGSRSEDVSAAPGGPRRGDAADDLDEQVQEVPRTYRGRDAGPVIGLGDELRSRFGDKSWFKQVEETLDKWGEKMSGGGGDFGSEFPGPGRERPDGGHGTDDVRPEPGTGHQRTRQPRTPDEDAGSFDLVVLAAGLHADRLAATAGLDPEPRIIPFTSDFFVMAEPDAEVVGGVISSVPDPSAPLTRTVLARGITGSLLLGPNTYPSLGREAYGRRDVDFGDLGSTLGFGGFWKFASQNAKTAMRGAKAVVSTSAFVEGVQRYVPDIRAGAVKPGPRGVHSQAIDATGELRDELIVTTRGRLTEVRNVPRWGAASALALAEHIADRALRVHHR